MDIQNAINIRRSYRSLEKIDLKNDIIIELANSARLAPSCFNHQPWRYIFVRDRKKLQEIYSVLTEKNKWAEEASLIVAVFSQEQDDCIIKERNYYLFDTGMATAFMILKATELGLVAHPIAGFSEKSAKELLKIPEEMRLITLLIIGKHSETLNDKMTEYQKSVEKKRPDRKPLEEFAFIDEFEINIQ